MNQKYQLAESSFKSDIIKIFRPLLTLALILAVFLLSLLYSDRISHSVKSGLMLCANVIIPSVFPFMILSDLLYRFLDFSSMKRFGSVFERVFRIDQAGLYPFFLGILCGFPLGVKCVCDLYRDGVLSKNEAERLIGFCNNTGPAFLVAGVGVGLRKSLPEGLIIYISMVLSAIIVGILFSINERMPKSSDTDLLKRDFSLTSSIKNAGFGTLGVCSYLTFFACIVGLLRGLLGETLPYLLIISFIEIGSAASILSKTAILSSSLTLLFTSFAVGFSGLSVHLQAMSYLNETDISVKKYFVMKLLEGIFAAAITFILSKVFL